MTAERDRGSEPDAEPGADGPRDRADEHAAAALTRLDAVVRGRVQGVGFRYFVMQAASGLPVSGWVANEPDGSVHCVAEGSRAAVATLLERLRDGPPGARVDSVAETWMPATGRFDGFRVRSSSHSGD